MCERGVTNMKSLLRLVAVVSMLGWFALQGRAQTSSGTISGHIVDQSNGIVVNAQVKLINQETNVAVSTPVRSNGTSSSPMCSQGHSLWLSTPEAIRNCDRWIFD